MSPDGASGVSHAALLDEVSWIRRLARELVADRELAEDLVQETCVAALEQAPREAGKLRQWLAAVLRNALKQHSRSHGRRVAREALGARPEALEPTDALVERVALQRELVGAVLELDEPYRSTVLLRFFQELPPREIARRTGVPVATVMSRLQRALAKLRERLDGQHRSWAALFLPWIHGLQPAAPTLVTVLMNAKLSLVVAGAAAAGVLVWWSTSSDGDAGARERSAALASRRDEPLAMPQSVGGAGETAPDERESVEVPAATVEHVEPALPATAAAWTVQLRVLDADARPLSGIPVGVEGSATVLGTSGRGGWCVFQTSGDGLALSALDPAWVTIHEGRARRGGAYDPVLVVAPAIELSGRVVDEHGAALTGARVRFELPHGFDVRFADVLEATRERSWIADSAREGAFALGRVPAVAGARVRAFLGGYEHAESAAPLMTAADLELVLRHPSLPLAGVLRGTVVDPAGVFVPAARVSLGLSSVLCDERGEFEIELARAVTADALSAVKAGFLPARMERPEEPGDGKSGWPDHVLLVLGGPALSIRGVVRDHEGAPLPKAKVWLHDTTPAAPIGQMPVHLEALMAGAPIPAIALESEARLPKTDGDHFWDSVSMDSGRPDAFWFWVETGADGGFELPGLDDRRYRLDVLAQDSLELHTSGPIAAGTHDAEIELDAPDEFAEVTGRVVSASGAPVEGVTVQIGRPVVDVSARVFGGTSQVIKVRAGESTRSDAEGRFRFTHVPRHGAALNLGSDEIVPARADVTSAELVVTVERRCHLEVQLRDPIDRFDQVGVADESGQGLDVLFLTDGSVTALTAVALVDGRSGIVSVSERARQLKLYRDGVVVETQPIFLTPGDVNRVEP